MSSPIPHRRAAGEAARRDFTAIQSTQATGGQQLRSAIELIFVFHSPLFELPYRQHLKMISSRIILAALRSVDTKAKPSVISRFPQNIHGLIRVKSLQ